jgi:hypothetical protein
MVGGIVVGIVRKPTESFTRFTVQGTGCERNDELCVQATELPGNPVHIADTIWWQGPWVFWTPAGSRQIRCGIDFDIKLPKHGYSYCPDGQEATTA